MSTLGARTKDALQEAVRLAIEAVTHNAVAAWVWYETLDTLILASAYAILSHSS